MQKTSTKIVPTKELSGLTLRLLARLAIVPFILAALPAWSATSVKVCGTPPGSGLQVKSYNNNDELAKSHSGIAAPYQSELIKGTNGSLQIGCMTSSCIIKLGVDDNYSWVDGNFGNMYVRLDGSGKPTTISRVSCDVFDVPNANSGFIFNVNHSTCIQQVNTTENGDVHMWNKCAFGDPMANRQWRYTASDHEIRTIENPRTCLNVNSTTIPNGLDERGLPYLNPVPVSGDRVVTRGCRTVASDYQAWEYNPEGKHQIRMLKFPEFCMFRSGDNVSDYLYVDPCSPSLTRGQWTIDWQ